MAKSKLERFEIRTIQRSQVNPAPYNPRSISEQARKQLQRSLKQFGLAEPLIWNETTGNLVGGHQRLSILDEERGYPAKGDYEITVSAVKLTLPKERQLNVWLNNQAAQGQFEYDPLMDIIREAGSLDAIGMTRGDMEIMFGEFDLSSIERKNEQSAEETAAALDAIKERKKQVRKEKAADSFEEDAGYTLLVYFESSSSREEFLRSKRLPANLTKIAAEELFAMPTKGKKCA